MAGSAGRKAPAPPVLNWCEEIEWELLD